jgi:hypothetical protein
MSAPVELPIDFYARRAGGPVRHLPGNSRCGRSRATGPAEQRADLVGWQSVELKVVA